MEDPILRKSTASLQSMDPGFVPDETDSATSNTLLIRPMSAGSVVSEIEPLTYPNPEAWEREEAEKFEGTVYSGRRQESAQSSRSLKRQSQTPLFGPTRNRVAPSPARSQQAAAVSHRGPSPDLSVFTGGSVSLAVEETTGETTVQINEREDETPSLPVVTNHQTFIPLAQAQKTVMQMVEDMNKMRQQHVRIVTQMQGTYRNIGEESQTQHNSYVLQLKQQHKSKVSVYKQIVTLLQQELEKIKKHYEGTSKSLSNRNRELLEENTGLYQQVKSGIARLAQEKEDLSRTYAKKLEQEIQRRSADVQALEDKLRSVQTECDAKLRRTAATAKKATASQSEEQSALQRTVQQLQGQLEERERQLAEAKASLRVAPVLHSRPPAVDAPEQVESNGSKVSLSSQAESSHEVTADVNLEEQTVATAIPSHQESQDVETSSETPALDELVITAEPSSAEKTIPSTADSSVEKEREPAAAIKDKEVPKPVSATAEEKEASQPEPAAKQSALPVPTAKGAASNKKKAAAAQLKKRDKDDSQQLIRSLEREKANTQQLTKTLEKIESQLKTKETEIAAIKNEHSKLLEAQKTRQDEIKQAAKESTEAIQKMKTEIASLQESCNAERVLRKKYYNAIEDMKGKIRVYCRARPLSRSEKERNNQSVIESPDEYSLTVKTGRGEKSFAFDSMFMPDSSQDKVFEDTKNLIQSAVDGYNVCIFAYGQTGSGKTYTMIGGKEGTTITAPGIAPRAFAEIFAITTANRKKFEITVSVYMLELYNDKLIDLFQAQKEAPRLDIKKDRKGMVMVQGAVTKEVTSAEELMETFDAGSKNRHVSCTKMNAESSRSHLVVGVVLESKNLSNGTVHKGKLSIVDLAGSERASKTGASAEQLKEAQSINKSLSALGDVISALSSGQDFIPYRNNKLTMLMQDSLGGNAKTLMFVNISPADYNTDESVISLTYAARVKLITNDASKNSDNKEIARLKAVIVRLKKGEDIDDDL